MYAEIAPCLRLPYTLGIFDYSIPEALASGISHGQIVEITFRGRRIPGVIMRLKETTELKRAPLPIKRVLSPGAALTEEQLALAEYISNEYYAALGTTMNSFLPHTPIRELVTLPEVKALGRVVSQSKPLVLRGTPEMAAHYLRKDIEDMVRNDRQILLLLPELWQERMWNALLRASDSMVRIFSTQKPADFFASWRAIASGKATMILGTRSAILSPFRDLGMILVADEGNENFKQIEPSPRYHARDLAFEVARLTGARVVCASLLPSPESMQRTRSGQAEYHDLFPTVPLSPNLRMIDRETERKKANRWQPVSEAVIDTIADRAKTGKVFVFLNKLGFSKSLSCRDCRHFFVCLRCASALTYRKDPVSLFCYHCQESSFYPLSCSKCAGTRLGLGAVGVERFEEEMARLLPGIPLVRIDSLVSAPAADIAERMKQAQVILGTKRAFAVLPWEEIHTAVVLGVDSVLRIPEFRAHERVLAMLTLLSTDGRELIIETSLPDHPVFHALRGSFEDALAHELEERKAWGYPPFARLVKVIVQDRVRAKALKDSESLVAKLKNASGVTVSAPMPQSPEYQWGIYRFGVLLRLPAEASPQSISLAQWVPDEWLIDVDPESVA